MIVRLLVYLAVLLVPTLFVAIPVTSRWRARRQGRLRAEYTCAHADCGRAIDPESDDSVLVGDSWWHRKCVQRLLAS